MNTDQLWSELRKLISYWKYKKKIVEICFQLNYNVRIMWNSGGSLVVVRVVLANRRNLILLLTNHQNNLTIVNFSKQEDALKNVDVPAKDEAKMMKMDSKALLGD